MELYEMERTKVLVVRKPKTRMCMDLRKYNLYDLKRCGINTINKIVVQVKWSLGSKADVVTQPRDGT